MTTAQIISIIEEHDIYGEFLDNIDTTDDSLTVAQALQNFYESTILIDYADEDNEKVYALMEHTDDYYSDCDKWIDNGSYRVLTDSEADDAWEESIDNYIEECILPEMPEHTRRYFDYDAFKSDAQYDGRGHSLAYYDGQEHDITINGTTYYIYKC